MPTDRNIRELIERELRKLMAQCGADGGGPVLEDDALQFDVDSMTLARLLIRLEAELGVDPFAEQADVSEIRTVTQLARVYEQALAAAQADTGAAAGA